MTNQQPEQHASATSASATRGTTTLSSKPNCVQPSALIHLQLTMHDLPLSAKGLLSWKLFLAPPYGLLERWTRHTTYKPTEPDNFLYTWPWNDATPTLTLGSDQTYETTEAAERDTYAALMILHSLGFVKVSMPDSRNIAMRWGYPDRQWLNKTMPQLVEKLGINWDDVGIPDVRWLEYIQWEAVGSRASEASR
ncbi:uncharacterized protein B0T23DRAFT_407554 [Neurospora hispaniola]|uniref:Uncharacterized protein n=1 Tax=Neurospora hispaniola TaxID=588809 RepID=A0AAJ0I0G0_9PEZI|nr:hypothetical protein B0T23DRAFT_407554 [Neurospora hispaniola]